MARRAAGGEPGAARLREQRAHAGAAGDALLQKIGAAEREAGDGLGAGDVTLERRPAFGRERRPRLAVRGGKDVGRGRDAMLGDEAADRDRVERRFERPRPR